MTDTSLLRNLVGVVLAITLLTAIGLAFGRCHRVPAETYVPADRIASGPTPERGAQVFQRMGCVGCHSTDGSARVGPSLAQRWGIPRCSDNDPLPLASQPLHLPLP